MDWASSGRDSYGLDVEEPRAREERRPRVARHALPAQVPEAVEVPVRQGPVGLGVGELVEREGAEVVVHGVEALLRREVRREQARLRRGGLARVPRVLRADEQRGVGAEVGRGDFGEVRALGVAELRDGAVAAAHGHAPRELRVDEGVAGVGLALGDLER